jgi:hypothetical protein
MDDSWRYPELRGHLQTLRMIANVGLAGALAGSVLWLVYAVATQDGQTAAAVLLAATVLAFNAAALYVVALIGIEMVHVILDIASDLRSRKER